MSSPLVIDTLVIPEGELHWTAVRASGPGGQNVNKVSSKVELCFDLSSTRALNDGAKARLAALAGTRLDSAGTLHIVVQETRDQRRNLELARERLAELVRHALIEPRVRKKTKPSRSARERRLAEKRRRSSTKETRGASHADG